MITYQFYPEEFGYDVLDLIYLRDDIFRTNKVDVNSIRIQLDLYILKINYLTKLFTDITPEQRIKISRQFISLLFASGRKFKMVKLDFNEKDGFVMRLTIYDRRTDIEYTVGGE